MTEPKELLSQLKKLEETLQPPLKEVSEAEHVKAHVRMAFENLYSAFLSMNKLLQYQMQPLEQQNLDPQTVEKMKKSAMQGVDLFCDLMDEEVLDPWQKIVPDQYMESFKKGLNDMHEGDCIGYSCSCMRCVAETYYKLPNSKTWKNKEEGSALMAEYKNLKEHQDILERVSELETNLEEKNVSTSRKKI